MKCVCKISLVALPMLFSFFLFQLIQVWVNLTKWLPFESGWWPICHQASFLCFYCAAESGEGNKAAQGWRSIIWRDLPHHKMLGFLEWRPRHLFPSVLHLFLLFYFPLFRSAFWLCFHLLSSPCSTERQFLSFCQSFGAGWSFWVLCFICFQFGLVCWDFY